MASYKLSRAADRDLARIAEYMVEQFGAAVPSNFWQYIRKPRVCEPNSSLRSARTATRPIWFSTTSCPRWHP